MEFYEVLRRRRSVRKFAPSEIGEEVLRRIVDAGRLAPSGCNLQDREYILIRERRILDELHDRIQPDFRNAAAAIAVVTTPRQTSWGSYWIEDVAAAVENMLLAIVNEGYDSVWIEGTMHPHEDWVKALLKVPEDKRLYAILPIGRAAREGVMAPKPPLDAVIHFDSYS